MTDRPILFSGPMVRAILDSRKTQTRRCLPKTHPKFPACDQFSPNVITDPLVAWYWDGVHDGVGASYQLPYSPGDRLWVREACAIWGDGRAAEEVEFPAAYAADDPDWAGIKRDAARSRAAGLNEWHIRPSIHMPRWASRLTLAVTDVRVQRLQEVSEADAVAEGCPGSGDGEDGDSPREEFRTLWDSLNSKRRPGWDANPWVCAVTFTVHRCNIDQMEPTP